MTGLRVSDRWRHSLDPVPIQIAGAKPDVGVSKVPPTERERERERARERQTATERERVPETERQRDRESKV